MHICVARGEVSRDPAVLVVRAHVVLSLVVLQPEVSLVVELHVSHLRRIEEQRSSLPFPPLLNLTWVLG